MLNARLKSIARQLLDGARLMIGLPNYDAYVAHVCKAHPRDAPMSYADFFRNRQEARYSAGGGSKCC